MIEFEAPDLKCQALKYLVQPRGSGCFMQRRTGWRQCTLSKAIGGGPRGQAGVQTSVETIKFQRKLGLSHESIPRILLLLLGQFKFLHRCAPVRGGLCWCQCQDEVSEDKNEVSFDEGRPGRRRDRLVGLRLSNPAGSEASNTGQRTMCKRLLISNMHAQVVLSNSL